MSLRVLIGDVAFQIDDLFGRTQSLYNAPVVNPNFTLIRPLWGPSLAPMIVDSTLVEVQLPALMVESIFFGVYFISFVACLRRLLQNNDRWARRKGVKFSMLTIVLLLFTSSSLHLALTLVRNMEYFVYQYPPTTIEQLGPSWLNAVKLTTVTWQAILADIVIIYRCWMVWNRSLLIVLVPALCWVANVAFGIFGLYLQITIHSGSRVHTGNAFWNFIVFLSLTILINVYSNSIIIWQIYRRERAWRPPSICSIQDIPQRNRLSLAKRIVLESGLLYTIPTTVLLLCHICRSYATYIVSAAQIPVTGIAFNLILARVADKEPLDSDNLPLYGGNGSNKSQAERSQVSLHSLNVPVPR